MPRVLLAQDDLDTRMIWRAALVTEPYECDFAAGGIEALRMWQNCANRGEPYDAVVTDVAMPGMDGVSLARAIRQSDATVPIAFVTAYTGAKNVSDAVIELRAVELRGEDGDPFPALDLRTAIPGLLARLGRTRQTPLKED